MDLFERDSIYVTSKSYLRSVWVWLRVLMVHHGLILLRGLWSRCFYFYRSSNRFNYWGKIYECLCVDKVTFIFHELYLEKSLSCHDSLCSTSHGLTYQWFTFCYQQQICGKFCYGLQEFLLSFKWIERLTWRLLKIIFLPRAT